MKFDIPENYRMVPIENLIDAPYNPRKKLKKTDKEYQTIARSLDRFGLVGGMVWNERTGHLVAGHQRKQILLDNGVEEVPVYVVDVDLDTEKAMNLMLNKSSGQWEDDMVKDLLKSLSVELIPYTGFNDDEYAKAISKGYDEVMMGALMEDEDDSLLKTNKRDLTMKVGNIVIEISEDEKRRFKDLYEQYLGDYNSDVGFVTWLLEPRYGEGL